MKNKTTTAKTTISACIITKNEEKRIEHCLEHLQWVDEIVIVDSQSTDKTRQKAKEYAEKMGKQGIKVRIFNQPFKSFDTQKNAAIERCTFDWILDIDADEIVTEKLRDEIIQLLNKGTTKNGFYIPREEYFLNRYLFDVPLIRLYRKGTAQYKGRVHEVLQLQGENGTLKGKIIHENYFNTLNQIKNYLQKADLYSTIQAQALVDENRASSLKLFLQLLIKPIKNSLGLLFYKGLIFKGMPGILWSIFAGYTEILTFAKYYELKQEGKKKEVIKSDH